MKSYRFLLIAMQFLRYVLELSVFVQKSYQHERNIMQSSWSYLHTPKGVLLRPKNTPLSCIKEVFLS